MGCAGAIFVLGTSPAGAGPQWPAAAPVPIFSAATAGSGSVLVDGDTDNEVLLAPRSALPLYGPRYAPVTLDLYLPFGNKSTARNLALLLQLGRENSDVRLILHPMLGSDVAQRGAEVILTAWRQSLDEKACFSLAEKLAAHPEWLEATPEAEAELLSAASALKLDAELLSRRLRQHAYRARLLEIWQRERNEVRASSEVWLNGRRLRGLLSDTQLREELDRQRSRAYQTLHSGTPLTKLYERLLEKERSELVAAAPWLARVPPTLLSGSPAGTGLSALGFSAAASTGVAPASSFTTSTRLDLSFSPMRGPQVAPVTLTLIGSLDSYGTYLIARVVREVAFRHAESVQLVFQHAPTTEDGRRVAQLLVRLWQTEPAAFWRAFDGILDLLKQRYLLRYDDVITLLKIQGVNVNRLEAALRDPAQKAGVRAILDRDRAQAQRLGLASFPVVLLNGRPLLIEGIADQLEHRVEAELKKGFLARWLRF